MSHSGAVRLVSAVQVVSAVQAILGSFTVSLQANDCSKRLAHDL